MSPDAVVFLGPSLSRAEAAELLQADYRPPVKRGDLAPLLAAPPRVVGIIDGEFYQSLSVSTKEILPLLEAGIQVMGAASMGALRAVETSRYGMIGVGRIFRMLQRREIDGDDEVAVTYRPDTYAPSSEPLVNYRLALADARKAGVLGPADSSRLIRRMKAIYFPHRTRTRFWLEAAAVLERGIHARLKEFFAVHRPDAKASDAAELLRMIGTGGRAGR